MTTPAQSLTQSIAVAPLSKPSSTANLFSRSDSKKKSFIEAVENGTVGNVDHSVYREFRAVTKACAFKHFPELFEEREGIPKFRLKGKIDCSIQDGFFVFLGLDEGHELYSTLKELENFLSSIFNYNFQGDMKVPEALPMYRVDSTKLKDYYVGNNRGKSEGALIADYWNRYGVEINLKAFSCPLSSSATHTDGKSHNSKHNMDHIFDKVELNEKLLAAVYILNKFMVSSREFYDGRFSVDLISLGKTYNKFMNLLLVFRDDKSTNPTNKKNKEFLFASKSLAVSVLNDIRNLIFICSTCNTVKGKKGWNTAIEQQAFRQILPENDREKIARTNVRTQIINDEAAEFKSIVVKNYAENCKEFEKEQDIKNAKEHLKNIAAKHNMSLDELWHLIKNE